MGSSEALNGVTLTVFVKVHVNQFGDHLCLYDVLHAASRDEIDCLFLRNKDRKLGKLRNLGRTAETRVRQKDRLRFPTANFP